jgi:hypothetical protein
MLVENPPAGLGVVEWWSRLVGYPGETMRLATTWHCSLQADHRILRRTAFAGRQLAST